MCVLSSDCTVTEGAARAWDLGVRVHRVLGDGAASRLSAPAPGARGDEPSARAPLRRLRPRARGAVRGAPRGASRGRRAQRRPVPRLRSADRGLRPHPVRADLPRRASARVLVPHEESVLVLPVEAIAGLRRAAALRDRGAGRAPARGVHDPEGASRALRARAVAALAACARGVRDAAAHDALRREGGGREGEGRGPGRRRVHPDLRLVRELPPAHPRARDGGGVRQGRDVSRGCVAVGPDARGGVPPSSAPGARRGRAADGGVRGEPARVGALGLLGLRRVAGGRARPRRARAMSAGWPAKPDNERASWRSA